jgi:Cof subfamily protein (haloacid dehalogenase superfamily)
MNDVKSNLAERIDWRNFMELIVFDLDGTLLDDRGSISDYTRDTLAALSERGVAYTVATGRTLHAARELLAPHGFRLPQVFKNGVMIWDPSCDEYLHQNFLSRPEIEHVLQAVADQGMTPFVFTLEAGNRHVVYHSTLTNDMEIKLAGYFSQRENLERKPTDQLPADVEITNISALGPEAAIGRIEELITSEPQLVAWSGASWEGESWRWIDIHHGDASKGGAIETLRRQLGVSRVVCFGDQDNDLSMFEQADESYAPENASPRVKMAATAVIGHHNEDGIARFLRQRFKIDP